MNILQPLFDTGYECIIAIKNIRNKLPKEIPYTKPNYKSNDIAFSIGKKNRREDVWIYLSQSPHTFIAGNTGSGKSVCLKSILTSIITNYDIDLYCIDPKLVELSLFEEVSKQTAYDIDDIVALLQNIETQCLQRFSYMKSKGITNLSQDKSNRYKPILLVIEECVCLLENKKGTMGVLKRILAIGRACQCYVILSMQRPSHDILDPYVKSLCSNRIVFRVEDIKNSVLCIDEEGAEQLQYPGRGIYKGDRGIVEFQAYHITDDQVKTLIKPHILGAKLFHTIRGVNSKEPNTIPIEEGNKTPPTIIYNEEQKDIEIIEDNDWLDQL